MEADKTTNPLRRVLTGFWDWICLAISATTVIVVVNHIFHLNLFGAILGMETSYLYLLLGLCASTVFLMYPIRREGKYYKGFYFFCDVAFFLATISICCLFAFKGLKIYYEGWMMGAPMPYPIFAFVLWILVLEAARRSQGIVITTIVFFFSLFPVFAEHMPYFLSGIGFSVNQTIVFQAFSTDGLIGLPMRVVGNLVIGFMIFGLALVMTGGAAFFMNFSLALMGKTRGGAAKVSVISSAFFGSMSGSVVSNVITTGSMTVPAMVRTGYPSYFAAAVEACSSTGGVLMPPIMGATAFIMAEFLNMPYLNIAVAAFIPSLLYYTGLLIQVDAHAARNGLAGLPAEEIPSIKTTLRQGWYHIGALVVLIFFLFLRMETQAPFYGTIFLFICASFKKENRITLEKLKGFLKKNIEVLSGLIALISTIGMIIGSLSVTGVAHGLSREIVYFAGDSVILMVLLGAFASFILGMGITITACYVLLAITLAPPLMQMGLDPLAVNLFLLYCGMVSFITLPVAVAVYTAAGLAGSNAIRTGTTAMRLGIVTYIVPFFFVFNPALILRGSILDVVLSSSLALVGVWLLASALGGYLSGLGTLNIGNRGRVESFILKPALFISGLLLGFPERLTDLIGLILAVVVIFAFYRLKKSKKTGVLLPQ